MVDDDEFQHRLLTQMLQPLKVDLLFADSGAGALGALRRRRPDLIFMDYQLPDLSGLEVARRLKASESFSGIPVVMITGRSERDIVVDAMKVGAADFIVKPFDGTKVVAKVRKLLGAESQAPAAESLS
jgi:DNA-binding response OmpR family regulator